MLSFEILLTKPRKIRRADELRKVDPDCGASPSAKFQCGDPERRRAERQNL